jgi:hypothetical protein
VPDTFTLEAESRAEQEEPGKKYLIRSLAPAYAEERPPVSPRRVLVSTTRLVQSDVRWEQPARTGESFMEWSRILDPAILGLLIPVIALLVGGAIAITKMITKHQERLAMIERGINPDAPNHP